MRKSEPFVCQQCGPLTPEEREEPPMSPHCLYQTSTVPHCPDACTHAVIGTGEPPVWAATNVPVLKPQRLPRIEAAMVNIWWQPPLIFCEMHAQEVAEKRNERNSA